MKRIKLLRGLDVPVAELRMIVGGERELSETLSKRKQVLQKEKEEREAVSRVCDALLSQSVSFSQPDADRIVAQTPALQRMIEVAMAQDTTKLGFDLPGYDKVVARLLLAAYLLGAVLVVLLAEIPASIWPAWLSPLRAVVVYVVISFVVEILIRWSANARFQLGVYALALATLPVAVLSMLRIIYEGRFAGFPGEQILLLESFFGALSTLRFRGGGNLQFARFAGAGVLFFLVMLAFTVLLWALRAKSGVFSRRMRYPVMLSLICGVLVLIAAASLGGGAHYWYAVLLAVSMGALAISWTTLGQNVTRYTMYYSIVSATRALSIGAGMLALRGNTKSWRRDGREFRK